VDWWIGGWNRSLTGETSGFTGGTECDMSFCVTGNALLFQIDCCAVMRLLCGAKLKQADRTNE
jgi:hypothetical protein